MSEHIHRDIVNPDGTVSGIAKDTPPGWVNGASIAPRRMKQPIKDELRRRLEVATAQAIVLQTQLDDAVPMATVRKLLVAAVVIGVALGKLLP